MIRDDRDEEAVADAAVVDQVETAGHDLTDYSMKDVVVLSAGGRVKEAVDRVRARACVATVGEDASRFNSSI
jgi:hypothetical protein